MKHLGITTPAHSTLAYANEHRPWELYQRIFSQLYQRCGQQFAGKKKFRFKNKLLSLDSSIIDLSVTLFDWAKFRRTKGAIKLHLLLDHDGYLLSFAWITEGKRSDVKIARHLEFDPGTIIVLTADIMITPCLLNGPLRASFLSPGWKTMLSMESAGRETFLKTVISSKMNSSN